MTCTPPELNSRYFRRQTASEQGLTLVELLVVSLLLAVLMGLLYGTLSGIMRAREQLLIKRQAYRTAATFFSKLRTEFASAQAEVLFQNKTGSSSTLGSGLGLSGAEGTQPARYFAGIDGKGSESDSIRFATSSGAQELYDADSNRGLIEVNYRVEGSSGARLGNSDFGVLVREEIPAGVKAEPTVTRRRRTFPVCDKVISLNFRYFRDNKWMAEWADSSSRLPRAIDVELILADDKGDPVYVRTALPFGPPKLESSTGSIQIADGTASGSPSPSPSPTLR